MEQDNLQELALSQRSEHIEVYQLDLDLASKLSSINWSAEYPVLCEKGKIDNEEDLPMVASCLLEEIVDDSETVDETENFNSESVSFCNSITHIEIIKTKAIAPRRVTGANRVVPFITSVWQNNSCKITEPSLSKLYREIIDNPDSMDDAECKICFQRLLSSFELEHHVVSVHGLTTSSEQCFVCRRKFVFQIDLKTHLAKYHGIQYPEMICKICFMEFHSQIENKAHERKHDKVLSCRFCSMKFASEYFYQSHFDNHLAGLKPFACNKCGMRYRNNVSLNVHQKRHLLLLCCFCQSTYDDELKLLMHLSTHEPEDQEVLLIKLESLDEEENRFDKMLECYLKTTESLAYSSGQSSITSIERDVEICVEGLLVSVTTPVGVDVEKKLPLVLSSNSVECKLCGVEVASGKVMMDHHRKSHLRNRTCLFCGKRNGSVPQTLRHMATHLNKATTKVGVDVTSARRRKGKKDKSQPTPDRPLHGCSSCSEMFRSKSSRDEHVLTAHTNEIKTSLQCGVCNQLFLRPKFLEKHMAQHDSNYQCETCGKSCSSHTKLRAHLRSHAPVDVRQKFKCSLCPVSCSTFSGLRVHLRIHTGERPYGCDQCKKRFKRLQAMKKHSLTVHRGPDSVSHACRECPMRFNDRGNLFRHFLLIHRGFRRFICGICGHRYGQNQDLQRHLKMKHQVDAPSITGKAKKSASDIYVIPSLDNLPLSDSHACTIRQIVDEEKLKFKDLEELEMMEDNPNHAEIQPLEINSSLEMPPSDDLTANEQDCGLENSPTTDKEPLEEVVQDFQPQFIPLLGLLAQVGKNQASQTNADHTSFKLQTCDLCNKLFYMDSTFKEHVRKRYEHSCNECPMKFCDGEKLQDHVTKEHSCANIIYQCGICMVQFSHTSGLMQQHMNEAHGLIDPNTNSLLTTNCLLGENMVYDLKPQLQLTTTHTLTSTSKTSCLSSDIFMPNVVFQSAIPINSMPSSFSDHRHNILQPQSMPPVFILQSSNVVSVPLPQPLTCVTQPSISEKVTVDSPEFRSSSSEIPTATVIRPAETKRGKKCGPKQAVDSLDCNQCGKLFVDRKRLIRHMNTHLGPCKPFGCPQCKKGFSEKHNLKVHMRIHTGERPYSCDDCGKKMRYQKEYADHKRMHEGVKPCVCEECGWKFLRRRELVRHALTHTGEKRFKCDTCDKGFGRKDQLATHARSHSELAPDRLFACHLCTKAYRSKAKLQGHLVSHTGEKRHRCTLCGKTFALAEYLRSHAKTHGRREAYVGCPKCPRRFSTVDNLEIHLKTFHTKHKKHSKIPQEPTVKTNSENNPAATLEKPTELTVDIDDEIIDLAMLEGGAYLRTVQDDLARALDNIPTG